MDRDEEVEESEHPAPGLKKPVKLHNPKCELCEKKKVECAKVRGPGKASDAVVTSRLCDRTDLLQSALNEKETLLFM